MLDTNVVSHIMQGRDASLLAQLTGLRVGQVFMSSVTRGELEYGLQRKSNPPRLRSALTQVLLRIDVLAWDEKAATCYGVMCAALEAQGINLSDFDMMTAAHAAATNTILVSREQAFSQIPVDVHPHWRLAIW